MKKKIVYAGFWKRCIAGIIDGTILNITLAITKAILHVNTETIGFNYKILDSGHLHTFNTTYPKDPESFCALLVIVAIAWLYSALLESSKYQATLGMKILSIKVTDYAGKRISFAQATLRYFAAWLSGAIFMIGYIMIAFTSRKQALHDFIAKTLVVKE